MPHDAMPMPRFLSGYSCPGLPSEPAAMSSPPELVALPAIQPALDDAPTDGQWKKASDMVDKFMRTPMHSPLHPAGAFEPGPMRVPKGLYRNIIGPNRHTFETAPKHRTSPMCL